MVLHHYNNNHDHSYLSACLSNFASLSVPCDDTCDADASLTLATFSCDCVDCLGYSYYYCYFILLSVLVHDLGWMKMIYREF